MNRAAAKMEYSDVRGALEDNLQALNYDSVDVGLHNNIGMTYGRMKNFEKAEFHLKKVLEIDSTFQGGLMNLGFLYSEMKNYENALTILTLAIEKFPDIAYTYNNRGMVKHRLHDSAGAIKDIEKSLKLDGGNSYAYRNLAIIYLETDKPQKACEKCKKALDLGYTVNYGTEMKKFYQSNCSK